MPLAERPGRSAVDVKPRSLEAGVLRATTAQNIHHTIISMILAVCRHLATFHVEARCRRARLVQAALAADIYHVLVGMLFAVHPEHFALPMVARSPCAALI